MKKLCVIFGGSSTEHDISIITGMQLCKNLSPKYDIEKIYLGLDNRFYLASKIDDMTYFKDKKNIKLKELLVSNGALYSRGLFLKKYCDISLVINCCHGGVGENGDLAGLFNVYGIPYTSAGSLSSHIAMDKSLTKTLVSDLVPTIKGVLVNKDNYDEMIEYVKNNFTDKLIVKPNSLGSSIGVKACDKSNFTEQIDAIFELNDMALVEERIVNLKEYNQACFKTKDGLILSAIEEPISKSDFLTFDEKYRNDGKSKSRDRIIPAEISPELEEKLLDHTSKIYTRLNMNGVARIDYIYDMDSETLYFNEINTIPGSMSFYLYEPLGVDYITLIEKIMENTEKTPKYSYIDTQILDKKLF